MSHLQLVPGRDKLGAVPEAGSRFDGHAVSESCNDKRDPTHQIVNLVVLLLHFVISLTFNAAKIVKNLLPARFTRLKVFKEISGDGISGLCGADSRGRAVRWGIRSVLPAIPQAPPCRDGSRVCR